MLRFILLATIALHHASGFALPPSAAVRSRLGGVSISMSSSDASLGLSQFRDDAMKKLREMVAAGDKQGKKLDLLALCDEAQRGVISPEGSELRKQIVALLEEVEKSNTVKEPLSSDLINGVWTLRWTTSASILGMNKPKFLRPDPKRPITQMIDAVNLKARNVEPCKLLWIKYSNAVEADLEPLSKSKVAVQFKRFFIGKIASFKAPKRARGELETTYVDEDMRISRGDKGNLFILTK